MGYLYQGKPGLDAINAQIMAERTSNNRAPKQRNDIPCHGTARRYRWDRQRKIEPCPACKRAATAERKLQNDSRRHGN